MSSLVSGAADRDSYCTPEWFTELLPEVDTDPATNARSTIRARVTYMLSRGENGLDRVRSPWRGMLWLNGPYSDLLPWMLRLLDELEAGTVTDAGVLVNIDTSTTWWRALRRVCPHRFEPDQRIAFDPPPGVRPSKNDRPQAMFATAGFRAACSPELARYGSWWTLAS